MMNNTVLNIYEKTKKDWDRLSSVRSSEETYELHLDKIDSKKESIWKFSTGCPILNHIDLNSLDDIQREYVMGSQLLEFVLKTTKFEIDYVNKVANSLALEKYNFEIPAILKSDALKIYTDEGYHAYFSKKISDQIIDHFEIKDNLSPYFLRIVIGKYFLRRQNIHEHLSLYNQNMKLIHACSFLVHQHQ